MPSRTGVMRVLAASLVGLALMSAVLLGWWGPHLARDHAQETASGTLDAATVALIGECRLVGAEGTAMARQVAQYAKDYGSITPLVAEASAFRAAGRQPGFAFAVLDPSGTAQSVAGAESGQAAARAGGQGASCSHNKPPVPAEARPALMSGGEIGAAAGTGAAAETGTEAGAETGATAETGPAAETSTEAGAATEPGAETGATAETGAATGATAGTGAAAETGAIAENGAGAASGTDSDEGWDGDLVVLLGDVEADDAGARAGLAERYEVLVPGKVVVGWVVVWAPLDDDALAAYARPGTSLALLGADGSVLAGRGPVSAVRADIDAGRTEGIAGGVAFAVTHPGKGLPYTLVASSPVRGTTPLRALAFGVLAIGLIGPGSAYRLAQEEQRKLNDELRHADGELALGRRALDDTLGLFGAALESTHDLEALLDTVVAACVHTAGAVAGLALLLEHDGHDQETLLPLGSSQEDDAGGAAAELPALAENYLAWVGSSDERTPLMSHRAATGPALAVPMTHGEKLVGVLVVARGPGGKAFDALAPMRVRQIAGHAGTAVENVRSHEEVRRLSVTDPLTGVGNVRQLSTTLGREVAGALRFERKLTVLMLDLDHFKRVNDTLGHQFGDVVLREFAHRLLGCVREMDTVARYGGEEFAIVLPETDVEGGRRVAERVLNEIRRSPIRHGDVEYSITVSIGVAGFPQHGRSVAEVLQSADAALYEAKKQGRDRWALADRPAAAPRVSQAG